MASKALATILGSSRVAVATIYFPFPLPWNSFLPWLDWPSSCLLPNEILVGLGVTFASPVVLSFLPFSQEMVASVPQSFWLCAVICISLLGHLPHSAKPICFPLAELNLWGQGLCLTVAVFGVWHLESHREMFAKLSSFWWSAMWPFISTLAEPPLEVSWDTNLSYWLYVNGWE